MADTLHAFLVFLLLLLKSSHADTSLNSILFNGGYEFIDLSHPFDNKTVYWPGNRNFEFTKKTEEFIGKDYSWYAANEFAAAEHGGTHLDAPYHFFMTGKHVGELALEKLIVPLIIVDISSKVNDNPNYVLYKHDLDYLINYNMGQPCVIIFKFGWSKHYNSAKYLGIDDQTKTLNFPGLSAEVIEWITSSYKNVVGIGVDVASVDPGSSKDLPVHKITARSGLYNMENVNLNQPVPEHFLGVGHVVEQRDADGAAVPVVLHVELQEPLPVLLHERHGARRPLLVERGYSGEVALRRLDRVETPREFIFENVTQLPYYG